MAVTVGIETPLQDDVRELVALLNEHLIPLSPLEFQWKMTVEEMAVFLARIPMETDPTTPAISNIVSASKTLLAMPVASRTPAATTDPRAACEARHPASRAASAGRP